MPPTSINSIGLRHLFTILLLVVGVSMAGYGGLNYYQQSQAVENTVEVNATVTETDIETIDHRRGDSYAPVVTFEYRYQGTSYTSNNIFPTGADPSYDSESEANEFLEEYEVSENITAYVNPSSPSDGFLKEEKSNEPLYFFAIGGFLSVVSAFQLYKLD